MEGKSDVQVARGMETSMETIDKGKGVAFARRRRGKIGENELHDGESRRRDRCGVRNLGDCSHSLAAHLPTGKLLRRSQPLLALTANRLALGPGY